MWSIFAKRSAIPKNPVWDFKSSKFQKFWGEISDFRIWCVFIHVILSIWGFILQGICTQKPYQVTGYKIVRFLASVWRINRQYTEFTANFQDFRFQNQLIFEISTKISRRMYEISRSCGLLDFCLLKNQAFLPLSDRPLKGMSCSYI